MLWVKHDVDIVLFALKTQLPCLLRHAHQPRRQCVGTSAFTLTLLIRILSALMKLEIFLHLFPPALQPKTQNHVNHSAGLEINP